MPSFDRSTRVHTSFADVHVAEAGPVDAAPILFLHGNPDSHHVWSGVVDRLKATRRCIAPDLPGYGDSGEMRDVTLEAQAAFVRELVDKLELTQFDFVIHDVGSTHGFAFIAASEENAKRVRTLTIMNGNFSPDYRWHFWARMWRTPIVGEIVMAFGNESIFVQQVRKDAPKMPLEYVRAAYAAYSKKTRRQVLRWYREADPEKLRPWHEKLLAALRGSIKHQVLWGDLDPYIPDKTTADRLGASGTVHHFEDCSHWVMAEDPERTAKLIAEFTSSPAGGAGPAPTAS